MKGLWRYRFRYRYLTNRWILRIIKNTFGAYGQFIRTAQYTTQYGQKYTTCNVDFNINQRQRDTVQDIAYSLQFRHGMNLHLSERFSKCQADVLSIHTNEFLSQIIRWPDLMVSASVFLPTLLSTHCILKKNVSLHLLLPKIYNSNEMIMQHLFFAVCISWMLNYVLGLF